MTATPEPQQPDESEHVCQCGHPAEFHPDAAACAWTIVFPRVGCPCPALDVRPEERLRASNRLRWLPHVNERPVAPSAQPDEVSEFPCGWCSGGGEHRTDCPSWTPAQPVRDTKEGRR